MFYVYQAKLDNEIIYIGKGTKYRYTHCLRKWKNCEVTILEYFESAEDAFVREEELIKKYGRKDLGTGTLLNKSNGGKYIKGSIYWKDKKLSNEHKEKIKKSCLICNRNTKIYIGEKNPFFGKKHTEETKKIMSEKAKSRPSPFKGKTHTKESNEKNRLAHLGKTTTKKIDIDKILLKKLKYEDKLTNIEIAKRFNCSLFPIKNAIKELKKDLR